MENTSIIEVDQEVVDSITCDVCGDTYACTDWEEIQEFLQVRFCGGYGSIFGDSSEVKIDICQCCLKEKLGKYMYINGERMNNDCEENCKENCKENEEKDRKENE